jgi:hypothetical protein
MSRLVATVLLTFQRFPIIPGTSPRHGRDKEPSKFYRLVSSGNQMGAQQWGLHI